MKKILVTGACGFIGSALVTQLRRAGHAVTACDLRNPQSIPDVIEKDAVDYFQQLMTVSSYQELAQDNHVDVIFHLAATPRMGLGAEYPQQVIKNNTLSLLGALEYCRANPTTRLIFTSSSSVVWADSARSPYTLSKLMGEQLVSTYRATYGVQASSVRLYNVYGPGEADYGQWTTVVRQFKDCMLRAQPLVVYGDGHARRDFTHIDDAVSGLVAVMNDPRDKNIFELGSGTANISILELARTFTPDPRKIVHAPARPWDFRVSVADVGAWPQSWVPQHRLRTHVEEWLERHSAELAV